MKIKWISSLFLLLLLSLNCATQFESRRTTADFNFDWKFIRGEQAGAEKVDFNDAGWREIRLPHDWSVEESFTQENTAGATAFLPGGIGWYRKTFCLAKADSGKQILINFDGIYNNSKVWINGHLLGERPYGYIGFIYDLTPYLSFGDKDNVLAVRANRSAYADCRWYPGSGIYRNVKLIIKDPVHIRHWGHFVSTPEIETHAAKVSVQSTVVNATMETRTIVVKSVVSKPDYKTCATVQDELVLQPASQKVIEQILEVKNPELWDTQNPNLYSVTTTLAESKISLDDVTSTFGVREFRYDAEKGFFLNGKRTLFKGVCLHHDGGLVGAAVPIGVWERRLKILKEGGVNAIRTAHNPPAEDFLDLCDRMGFLVQDEAFDEWNNPKDKRHNYNQQKAEEVTRGYTEHFDAWAEADVKNMVLRDRNHPSIVMWSIGNEIEWTYPRYGAATGYWERKNNVDYYFDEPPYSVDEIKKRFYAAKPGKYELAPTAQNLSKWIREIDTTRPVTANLVIPSVSSFSGYTDALDIIGYSYRQSVYDYGHRLYPDKMIVGTENWTQWHEWKPILECEYNPGIFLWTGINYMGESGRWPNKGSGSGLLDFAGFRKPSYFMFNSLWNEDPNVYITTQKLPRSVYKWDDDQKELVERSPGAWKRKLWGWHRVNTHWNYEAGDSIVTEVYTNCRSVELFVNGKSCGSKELSDFEDHIIKWLVPYSDGTITAVGDENVRYEIQSAGEAASIRLTTDKTKLNANGYDVVHIVAQLVDAQGHPVFTTEADVHFDILGDCRLLGVDNGSTRNVQDYQTDNCKTLQGRCLLILQSNLEPGSIQVRASSEELESRQIQINMKR